ncbi:MAG TPA: NifB/NifX family molybdenum-iron cluster-binding protein [Candidatus Pullichristensenella stercorigallinarum]|uniref:NifB/NifX family molybdenum-iron cluster-binding protein n=1 Tax=Candidatus Pullichristensenella stercorigallinarum TaxID=2840909 RepID=A0A9D1CWM4_9FIRM|nr:NifB/NifX family molybdenum-iron cluster-binding protein [Candidatus Pullichristensenella stercorigallinarum]
MRIAVTYDNGEIFQHFGHARQFKLYDVENGAIQAERVVEGDGAGHGALAGQLRELGVDALICGGMGEGARMALAQMGVAIYAGVRGSADEAVRALLAGTLQATATATCDHHGHEHGHDCGSHHDCSGNHGCGGHEGGCH